MKSNTVTNFSNFIKYMPVLKKIGLSSVSKTELKRMINELLPELDPEDDISFLDPFVRENKNNTYGIDMEVLRKVLGEFFKDFLPGVLSEETIQKYITSQFHGKVLVSVDEVENTDHQSYKHLYQMLSKKHEELMESFYEQKYDLDNAYRDLAEQNAEIKRLRENNGNMKNTTTDISEFIKDFLTKDIIIQKVEVFDKTGKQILCGSDAKKQKPMPELSNNPGIYSFKRPSWFTPLKEELELSKKNVSRRNAKRTEDILRDKVLFWKLIKKDKSKIEKKAQLVDETRKRNIEKILLSDISNEEKYIKYILLTPGMDKDFRKTLNGAAELGLNANMVIELLEQPAESFNKEVIEAYVSKVHKATEYNLKLELAEELIRGEWYVTSEINGSRQKYQLVPLERLMEVSNRLQHICDVFEEYEKLLSSTSCHDGTKLEVTNNDVFANEIIESNETQIGYSDSELFDEPTFFMEQPRDNQEEMEILFVQQVESEFDKFPEDL